MPPKKKKKVYAEKHFSEDQDYRDGGKRVGGVRA